MTYKYWEIEIDGPDKTGKDLLCRYLCEMSGWRFSINVRGLISQLVYAKKFGRDFEYDTSNFSKNKVLILLTGEPEDISVRCKATHEPSYNIEGDLELFREAAKKAKETNIVVEYNTSYFAPYTIAQSVLNLINQLEENENGKV